ncbi:MAG: porin [Gemmatimonadales bacterium]
MHTRQLYRALTAAALSALALASAAAAQAPSIRVAGRVQAHFRAASGDSSANFNPNAVHSGFEIRRLRIQTDVRFGDNISLVIQPSFEMGALRMRDAFLRVGLTPRVGITMGQEKSPFQRYELNSSNNLLSIERGVRILALRSPTDPGGEEGLNDLLVNNGYASHDLGAFVDVSTPDNRVVVKLGFANGSRESATDVNNAKSFFGRATATLLSNADAQPVLQVGASLASRDRAVCATNCPALPATTTAANTTFYADSVKRTSAIGLDLEYGGFRPGWHVFADFATGDNVPLRRRVNGGRNSANLRDTADSNVVKFVGIHLVAAYRKVLAPGAEPRLVQAIEPALRVDYTDPDTDAKGDHGTLITPALNVYFANTVVLRAALDLYRYRDAGSNRSAREFKISWQANF